MTSIHDIEDFLDNEDLDNQDSFEENDNPKKKKQKARTFTDDKFNEAKIKFDDKITIGTPSDALTRNARVKLEYYLKQTPQYKVLLQQMDILKIEFDNYKATGEKELAEKTKQMINDLSGKSKKFVKMFKKEREKTDKNEVPENAELISDLKKSQKEIKQEIKEKSVSFLTSKVRQYRQILGISKDDLKGIDIYDEVDDFEVEDIDNHIDVSNSEMEYNNLCAQIADMCDILPSEVAAATIAEISKMLKSVINQDEIEVLKSKLNTVNIQISTEIAKAKGYEDVTNIIFDVFDFETVEEERPKEMLAASNIELVKSIAYKQCVKLNMLHYMEDAIAYGLIALTESINNWYKIQKVSDSAISFSGFAYSTIGFAIQKGLYELSSGGRITANNAATEKTKRNQQIAAFLKDNPELKGLPESMIEPLIEGLSILPKTITESAYKDMVGGDEDGDNNDIFANAAISTMDTETMANIKDEFETLTKSLKKLFNLFDAKLKDGEVVVKTTKMFKSSELILFKLAFGVNFKTEFDEKGNKVTRFYNQSEMAEIITAYDKSIGKIPADRPTYNQSAISDQIKRLQFKIKNATELYPDLKPALEYLFTYIQGNFDVLGDINKELSEIKMETEFQIPTQVSLEDDMEFEDEEFEFEEEMEFEDENEE